MFFVGRTAAASPADLRSAGRFGRFDRVGAISAAVLGFIHHWVPRCAEAMEKLIIPEEKDRRDRPGPFTDGMVKVGGERGCDQDR